MLLSALLGIHVLTPSRLVITASLMFAGSTARADDWQDFKPTVVAHSHALWQLDAADGPNLKPDFIDASAETARTMLATKALVASCAKYATVAAPAGTTPYLVPARACNLASRADELTRRFVDVTAKRYVDDRAELMLSGVAQLAKSGTLDESSFNQSAFLAETRTAMAAKVAKLYEVIATEAPLDLLKRLDDVPPAFEAAVKTPPTNLPTTPRADKALEKVARDHFAAGKVHGHRYTVRGVWVGGREWTMRRNELSALIARDRSGHALVQVEGETFCRLYEVTFTQQYAGGGNFQEPGAVTPRSQVHVAACAK